MNLVASLTSPEVLKQWQKEEEQILKAVAVGIIDAGANVVSAPHFFPLFVCCLFVVLFYVLFVVLCCVEILTTLQQVISSGLVHKYILHWLDMYGIVVVQSVPKADLIHISEATGARLIYQLPTTATTSTSTTTRCHCHRFRSLRYHRTPLALFVLLLIIVTDFGMADSFETRSISGEDYSLVNVPRTV